MNDIPRDLRYEKQDTDKYQKLTSDKLSPFYKGYYKDVFLYAATYGFKNDLKKGFVKPSPNIPLSAFSEEELWIMRSFAIAESNSIKILEDESNIFELAELYANGAIEEIYLEVFGGKPGEPYKRILQKLMELA